METCSSCQEYTSFIACSCSISHKPRRLVLGLKSAFGTLSGAISQMPVTDLPPPSAVFSSSGIGTSTVREANGSPVANNSPPLDGFIVEDCSDDEELEEEQIDFTFYEEEDEGSSPSSPAPVTLELPASPKGKEEATTVEKAGSASVATKKNVKGSVFTRLSPIVDTLVDALPAAALPFEVSPVDAPLVDALKLNAPIVP
ncbi:hypothetical protein POTOM_060359 [Populus tomentosa]|uniref:Uncharacterized protein n=1 Tax=Populus tomentosa TaxID=118781 RepID=A0A8X8C121_POPTO|nr:hypothetical protein POTOM_060359 [Populus tomentosa]